MQNMPAGFRRKRGALYFHAIKALCLLALAAPLAGVAETPAKMPDLLGSWRGGADQVRGDQRVPTQFRIDFARQDGTLLWAYDIWRPWDEVTGEFSTTEIRRDLMMGSVSPDGVRGAIAKDAGFYAFRLLDENRMEATFFYLGKPVPTAFVVVLSRGGKQADAPARTTNYPDIRGLWSGAYRFPIGGAPGDDVFRIDVKRQEAGSLWADDVWHPLNPATGQPAPQPMKDRLVGGFDAKGDQAVLAKSDAFFTLDRIATNQISVAFVRIGGTAEPPTAFCTVLRKDDSKSAAKMPEAPKLNGTWEGPCKYAQEDGVKPSSMRIEFRKQDGALLWADNVWHPLDPATGKAAARPSRDPLAGYLRPDGISGVLVKEGAWFSFRLVATNTLQVEFVRLRAGGQQPTAFYCTLTRIPD